MPYFLITARAHVLDTNLFEQFFVLLNPWMKQHGNYAYSVEKDMTIDRHIHLLVEDNAKDRDAMSRKFTTKTFKQFKQHLSSTNTIWESFLDIKVVKNSEEDFLKSLGYVLKDNTERRGYNGFTESKILEATKYYFVSKHVDKSIVESDIKLITTKNIYAHVKDFVQSKNLKYSDPTIQLQMVKSKFGFCNISPKNIRRVFNELKVMSGDACEYTEQVIMDEQQGQEEYKGFSIDVKILLDELSVHVPIDELPTNVQHLFKKYT